MGKLLSLLTIPLLIFGSYPLSDRNSNPKSVREVPLFGQEDEFTEIQLEFFESRVRPLLVEHCYDCHGPDADPPEGGLSLISRKAILLGGDSGPGINLDNPSDSLILDAVEYGDLFEMPPDSKLSDEDVEIFRKWINEKAPWPKESDVDVAAGEQFDIEQRMADHWCWQPVTTPAIPTNDKEYANWPNDPLDSFILQKLLQAELVPAPETDRRTWIRRVTYDITGMPPTTKEIQDFLTDTTEAAFENVVDRLLASPRYGERWTRHWMDLIRYAETCGHEFDYPLPYAFQYRDYLIRAFNQDVPYDQFLVEHLAGDLLKNPRRNPDNQINESILGTGFWFLGEATHAPVDVKGDEAGRIDNQIDVMTKTFTGLTVACARCHDHKFDAISAADYYGLAGLLQSSRRQNAMLDPHGKIESAHAKATKELESLAKEYNEFLLSVPDPNVNFEAVSYEDFLYAAVKFLQQDRQWLLPTNLVLEDQSLSPAIVTAGNANRQDVRECSGQGHLWWSNANVGEELEVDFDPPIEGHYQLFARLTRAPDYATIQVFVNDKLALDSFDLYAKTVTRGDETLLGKFHFDDGPQQVRIKITGKNDEAVANYMVGLDNLILRADLEATDEQNVNERRQALSKQHNVSPELLRNWIEAIKDPATTVHTHPFYFIRRAAESQLDLDSESGKEFFEQTYADLLEKENAFQNWYQNESELFDPLNHENLAGWDKQGYAFQQSARAGLVNFQDRDWVYAHESDFPHSGILGTKFQGVLRSPTFEITSPNIFYHLAARNAQIRLVVDGFRMDVNNALLFNDLSKRVDTGGEWKWIKQSGDLKKYLGHNAFIELIDQGDGFLGLKEIRVSDVSPPEERPSPIFRDLNKPLKWSGQKPEAQQPTPLRQLARSMAMSLDPQSMYSYDRHEHGHSVKVTNPRLMNFMLQHGLNTRVHAKFQQLKPKIAQCKKVLEDLNQAIPKPLMAISMIDGSPENEFVFIRGNHKNLGAKVERGPITALRKKEWDPDLPTSGRLRLAANMTSLDHPLTRRVIANRIWHHMTGRGLVSTVDNFGVLGQEPSHPELLDYLANEFANDGWSIKKMIRRIALSSTYRMSSVYNVDKKIVDFANEKDADNKLLHKFRVRRIQGEAIRDSMLLVSGELDEKMYGPSVPIHLTSFMQGRGRPGKSGPLNGNGRRSLYIEVRRNFLPPMMLAFDTPVPFNSIGRRTNSNVPAQALILMNDPFVHEQSKQWARRLLDSHESSVERIQAAFESAMGRPPLENEISQFIQFLDSQRTTMGTEATEHDLWTDFCHVLFNLKEFIYLK